MSISDPNLPVSTALELEPFLEVDASLLEPAFPQNPSIPTHDDTKTFIVFPNKSLPPLKQADIYDMGEYRKKSVLDSEVVYAMSMIAVGNTVINQSQFLQARQLRARVYIGEKNFLPPSALMDDGGEMDVDDARSIHYAATETIDSAANVIGTSRMLVKRTPDDLLPVERLFDIKPAEVGSIESSRYIARHQDRRIQGAASLALIRAMTFHSVAMRAPHLYAVIEQPLFKMFQRIGIPFEQISDPEYIEEYNTNNFAVRCVPDEILSSIRRKDEGRQITMSPFFDKVAATNGLGWFDKEF